MSKSVFDFKDYRLFLKNQLSEGAASRGQISKLARYLHCQSSFLSQVLTNRSHLSLEHAHSTTQFLNLSETEQEFFMQLVHENRAGSQPLKNFHQKQMKRILKHRQLVRDRIRVKEEIKEGDRAVYYSAWWYAAIHILTSLPNCSSANYLAQRLNISPNKVRDALDFLCEAGLVKEKNGNYSIGTNRIHLDRSSPLITKQHLNWRLKCVSAIENSEPEDLNYSSVMAISTEDWERLKNFSLELIQKSEELVRKSPEQEVYVFLLDTFRLR